MAGVSVENYNSYVNNELDILMMSAVAAAIIVVRRRRRRLQHRRQLWTKSWLMERDTDRGISHFVSYELPQMMHQVFTGFLRMPPDGFQELLCAW
jgi:hypothetical protein